MIEMDIEYQKHNLFSIKNGVASLSELGACYGMAAFVAISVVNKNLPGPLEWYQTLDSEKVPYTLFEQYENGLTLTKDGLDWIFYFFMKHPFNQFLYEEALYYRSSMKIEIHPG